VIALLVNPNNAYTEPMIPVVQEAARVKGLQLPIPKASTEGEIDTAFATLVQLHADGLVVGAEPFFYSRREQLVALASRYAISVVYGAREEATAGGLISYGPSLAVLTAMDRQAGIYAGRILKGEKPAGPAADDVRAGHQSQDRQGARHYRAANPPRPCRRGDRITR
jgi:putative ABC transport system substrate-binding protein